MGIFSKKKKGDDEAQASEQQEQPEAPVEKWKSDPKKARRFFDHAKTVADSRNYDYAIECYVNGLKHAPDAMNQHEALHDVAKRRKANGGKPAGMKEKIQRSGGKTALDKMLNAEFLWAKDPINPALGLAVMESAVKAEVYEVAYWIGNQVLDVSAGAGVKAGKKIFGEIADLFAEIGAYDKACEAFQVVLAADPTPQNQQKMRELETERTMQVGKYGSEEGFRASVRDADKQRELEQDDTIAKTSAAIEEQIKRLRAALEEEPEDLDLRGKLAKALVQKEEPDAENEAIAVLEKAHELSGQYRYKVQVGDIRIKQMSRNIRTLRKAMAAAEDPQQKAMLEDQVKDAVQQQLEFELKEYEERVKNYPTDMGLKYRLGRRQFALKDYDAAIASFQQAQQDPKHRAEALRYLGEAFYNKEWFDEAIDTYHRGIEVHPYTDDRLALELRYELANSLEQKATRDTDLESAKEALELASEIAQTDFNYKDIRERVERMRKLVGDLKSKSE